MLDAGIMLQKTKTVQEDETIEKHNMKPTCLTAETHTGVSETGVCSPTWPREMTI